MVHCQTAAAYVAARGSHLGMTIPPPNSLDLPAALPYLPRPPCHPPLQLAPQHIIIIIDFLYGQAIQVLEKSVSCLESVNVQKLLNISRQPYHSGKKKVDAPTIFPKIYCFLCLPKN